MANELDEMTGPVNGAGRDINVIERQSEGFIMRASASNGSVFRRSILSFLEEAEA